MTEHKRWRVVVWAAVSSKEQAAEDKASLPEQEREGREFAETVGGLVVDVLTVPGHSRDIVLFEEATQQMPAYVQLREHCEARDFDVLWARDPDRLGRDPALAQTVASLVERAGAEMYVASAPHVLGQGTVGQRYVYAIQSVRAGEDQRQRVRYMKMGMRKRLASGLPANFWPIGYRAVRDPLSGETVGGELDELAPAVCLATRLFIAGHSYAAMIAALEASPYRPVRADHWCYGTVRRMMYNDTYAGYVSWGEYRNPEMSDRYPAIWDAETFEAVQRERGRRGAKVNAPSDGSPFLDVAFCARCGERMTLNHRRRERRKYLRCSTHAKKDMAGGRQPCHANHIPQSHVREAVAAFLAGVTDLEAVRRVRGQQRDDGRERARVEGIGRELENADVRRRRLALAYAAGAMDVMVYQAADEEIVRQVDAWKEERGQLEMTLASTMRDEERFAAIESVRPLLGAGPDDAEPREIATALQNAGVRVWCEEGEVVRVEMV